MYDRNIAPALIKPDEIKIREPEKIVLENGIPIYVINAGEQDVIKIEIIFKAGASEHKNFLIAGATNELLDEGTKHHSAVEIAEEFEFYGAFLHAESTADWASVSLITLNKFLEKVFPLYHEIISEPVFPEQEIETFKIQNKQRLQVNNNKVDYVARKTFNQKLFGQLSPYGFYQAVEDYDKIDKNTLLNFHHANYLNGIFAIVVSGKVRESALKLISNFFGKTPLIKNTISTPGFQNGSMGGKYFMEKQGAVQSGLRIGRVLFNKAHPDYKGMSILNTILGGYFGSRLMSNIREDKGYTYGIGSALVSLQNTGYFFIATEVGVEVRDAALKEIYFEIKKLRGELIPAAELELVRNYLIGAFQRSIDGPFALADRLKSILTFNLGYEYFYEYIHSVHTISSEKIQNLAQKYLSTELLTEVKIG